MDTNKGDIEKEFTAWVGRKGLSPPELLFSEQAVMNYLGPGPSLRRVWEVKVTVGQEIELVNPSAFLRPKE